MKRAFVIVALAVLLTLPTLSQTACYAAGGSTFNQARTAARQWVTLVDKGKYAKAWVNASVLFQVHVAGDWTQQETAFRNKAGAFQSRTFESAHVASTVPGLPRGNYIVVSYGSSFRKMKTAVETITMVYTDQKWKTAAYTVTPQ